jgi:hypothetical protein
MRFSLTPDWISSRNHRNPSHSTSVASRLSAGLALEPPDVVLAGLVTATGLDTYVLADTPPHARPYLQRVVGGLPPSLREVVAQTAAAVGDAVLNART